EAAVCAARCAGHDGGFGGGRPWARSGPAVCEPRDGGFAPGTQRRIVARRSRDARRKATGGGSTQSGGTDRRGRIAQTGRDSDTDRSLRNQHGGEFAHAFRFHAAAPQTGCGRTRWEGRSEAGIPDLHLYSSVDDDRDGWTGVAEAVPGSVPHDAELWEVSVLGSNSLKESGEKNE